MPGNYSIVKMVCTCLYIVIMNAYKIISKVDRISSRAGGVDWIINMGKDNGILLT